MVFGINKPNFLIVGAAKSGTTSLVDYLSQHPDIHFHPNKELRFFVKEKIKETNKKDPMLRRIMDRSILDKEEYFKYHNSRPEKLVGEASVHYLYHHKEAIKNIKATVGDIPIIIILRNPVDRALSNWAYNKSDNNTFKTSLTKENVRKKEKFNCFWYYKELGEYATQVESYKKNFTNVKVLIFEEFIKNMDLNLNETLSFLGVNELFPFDLSKKSNETNSISFKFSLLRKTEKFIVIRDLLHYYEKYFSNTMIYKSTIIKKKKLATSNDKRVLKNYYKEDIAKLEKILNKNLRIWKNKEY